jgi:deoxyribose-phosphate aldolase
MDKSLVEKITREVVARYSNKGVNKKVLAIFMGGDRNLAASVSAVANIADRFETKLLLSKSAEKIIGADKLAGIKAEIIHDDGKQNPVQISSWPDVLVIPVLTLNGLTKIAGLMPDSLHSNIIIGCLERGIPVIAARDSIWCSCYNPPAPGTPLYKKVEEYVSQIRGYGIKVVTASDLAVEVLGPAQAAGGFAEKEIKLTMSSGGKIFDGKSSIGGPSLETSRSSFKFSSAASVSSDTCPAFSNPGVECSACGRCVERKAGAVKAVVDAGASRISATDGSAIGLSLAPYIDHTLLKANATQEEIGKLCAEARKYLFASVCVNPANVSQAAKLLAGCPVKVCTVIGFPLGATTPTVKAIEARDAIANGAGEIDMVLNVGALKSGNYQLVLDDIKAVREATRGKLLKVRLETADLNKEEKIRACQLSKQAGADFVKTSTGFGPSGATVEDIRLMRETVGPGMGVKASGGIRTQDDAKKMVDAGATRVGASASVAIVLGQDAGKGKY